MNLNYNGLCESKLYSFISLNKYLNQCNACLFSYKGARGDETKGRPVMIDRSRVSGRVVRVLLLLYRGICLCSTPDDERSGRKRIWTYLPTKAV